jgi:hypothetical protein
MSKKPNPSFLSGLRDIKDEHAVIRPGETAPRAPTPAVGEASHRPAPRQQGRLGKVSITQWVDPVVRKQIAQLALDEDKNQQDLVNEALNLLFEKYGRSPIA